MSPYAGTCEFSLFFHRTAFHEDYEDAHNDHEYVASELVKHRHNYAFRSGEWAATHRQYYVEVLDEWFDCEGTPVGSPSEVKQNLQGCAERLTK